MSVALKLFKTFIAMVLGSVVSALIVCWQLPAPNLDSAWKFSQFSIVVLFCLIGPILFPWSSAPRPLSSEHIALGVVSMIVFILTYRTWFVKERGVGWLAASAAVWAALGGYSALVIISASI